MNDENDNNHLNSLLARKIKVLNLKKREIARYRNNGSKKRQERDISLSSSESTVENSYSDAEFETEKLSKFLRPTTVTSISKNKETNTAEDQDSYKNKSYINSAKKISIISEVIIKKPECKLSKCHSTRERSNWSEELEATIDKNVKHPDLKEFDERTTAELLEKLSGSEDNTATSINQSSISELDDEIDIENIQEEKWIRNNNAARYEENAHHVIVPACSNDVNAPAEDDKFTPETSNIKTCSAAVNPPIEDAGHTPEASQMKTYSENPPAEDTKPTPETSKIRTYNDDVNPPIEDAGPTPETSNIKTYSVNPPSEDTKLTPETSNATACSDNVDTPAEDAGATPEIDKYKCYRDETEEPAEDPEPSSNKINVKAKAYSTVAVYVPDEDAEPTLEASNATAFSDVLNKYDENVAFASCQADHSTKRKPKRRAVSEFTKSCIDFMLQEDLGDFTDGSSDLWSPKDSDSDSLTDEEKKRNKKKLKRQRQKEKKDKIKDQAPLSIKKLKRENKVKKRKELKAKGLTYETSSGQIKEPRRLKENSCMEGKCPRKCFEIPEERRESLFSYFWELDNQRKKEFIIQCTRHQAIKRKKTDVLISRRNKTYEYYINEGEGRRQVCQKFLLNTLDISQSYLLYNANNTQEGISQQDQRRRHAINKYDETAKRLAKEYIESLPVLPSHYNRKNSTRLYLPQDFKNMSNLYRLYKRHCENHAVTFLSERLFTNLFRTEYNIAFHIPKKDKCKFCTKYENSEEKTEKDLEEYKIHKEEKIASYKRCEIHRNLVSNTVLTSSFDLQKVLNTPHGESMILYYSRKYTMYNLTVYESRTQNGYCYTWGEADGKRGSAEIGTCLYKYLKEVEIRGVKYLILYCDSCSGQNKNKVILSVLRHFLENSINLEVIQINYLLPGHTYMPVDSMHSVIEREVRKLIVWSPVQWPTFMQTARKIPRPYEVNVLEHTDFIDWHAKANEIFTPGTISNKDLRMRDLRVVTIKKQSLNILEVKYSMKEDGDTYMIPLKLNAGAERRKQNTIKGKSVGKGKSNQIENRPINEGLTKLYPTRLPISLPKYNDLKKLCEDGTIPKIYHKDYLTLPHDTQVIDTVSENEEENVDENTGNSIFRNEPTQEEEEAIPYFENIHIKKRKITKAKQCKEIQESTPDKRKKVIPKILDKDDKKTKQIVTRRGQGGKSSSKKK